MTPGSTDDTQTQAEVQQTYDRIGQHFSRTRDVAWPEIEEFCETVTGDRAIDLGCGNGRHLELLSDTAEELLGVDISRVLLREAITRARNKGYSIDPIQADVISLPIQAATIDIGIYIATLHHLSSRHKRVGSLNEFARILRPNSQGIISVWSIHHERFDRSEGFDTYIDWTLPNGETVPRFYHIYDSAEFKSEIRDSNLVLQESYVSSGNCFAEITI
ncbi:MAG: class I SAM-dependent methyltransferase [Halobacteriaceae archaeon]